MIQAGESFYTAKSGEYVTAIDAPVARGNGVFSVLVRTIDGSERWTSIRG